MVVDCVCYADESASEWKSEEMKNAAKIAAETGNWNDSDIAGAVRFTKMTATKSLERIAEESAAESWRLSGTSGETPGEIAY